MSTESALVGGYHLAFTIAAICVAAGALVAAALLRPPRPSRPERLPVRPLPAEAELDLAEEGA